MTIDSLIKDPANSFDTATNVCIELLSFISRELGVTYGELNIYIFVIFYPMLLLCFIAAALVSNKKVKRILLFMGFASILTFVGMLAYYFTWIMVAARGIQ